jgi:hypothetical protein
LSLLFALGVVVGLLLVKHAEWLPAPVAHILDLGDVYPTQSLIGPQKIIPFGPPAALGSAFLLQCMSLLLAQSGHDNSVLRCLLSGGKADMPRTYAEVCF